MNARSLPAIYAETGHPSRPEPDWHHRARCRWLRPPDLFFPVLGRGCSVADRAAYARQIESAKKVCAQCPVVAECLAEGKAQPIPHGIWGGELFVREDDYPSRRRKEVA
jgi:hypothetical protein